MSVLPILTWPDPVLSAVCAPVKAVTPDVRRLAEDMVETMYAAPGRGLAAPQVGQKLRMFVMDVTWKDEAPSPMFCLNPTILDVGREKATSEEGCLSIPGVLVPVNRPAQVTLMWMDLDDMWHEGEFDGFEAACIQHEMDHLDGIVTFDHLSDTDRVAMLAEYEATA